MTLEPAVAATVGALLLGQAMGLQGVLAIACVTAAALGVTISVGATREDSRPAPGPSCDDRRRERRTE